MRHINTDPENSGGFAISVGVNKGTINVQIGDNYYCRTPSKTEHERKSDKDMLQRGLEVYRKRRYFEIIINEHQRHLVGLFFNPKIGWMKYGQKEKILDICGLEREEFNNDYTMYVFMLSADRKTVCKMVAALLCDTFWSMSLTYWFWWRLIYYAYRWISVEQLSNLVYVLLLCNKHAGERIVGTDIDYSVLKRYKWLYKTKTWLFGAVKCESYEYLWVLTIAQLDIIAAKTDLVNSKK